MSDWKNGLFSCFDTAEVCKWLFSPKSRPQQTGRGLAESGICRFFDLRIADCDPAQCSAVFSCQFFCFVFAVLFTCCFPFCWRVKYREYVEREKGLSSVSRDSFKQVVFVMFPHHPKDGNFAMGVVTRAHVHVLTVIVCLLF